MCCLAADPLWFDLGNCKKGGFWDRLDAARPQPGQSVVVQGAQFYPILQEYWVFCWDCIGSHAAFCLLAVIEIIFLEEPSGAHVALVNLLWALVCVFVGKAGCPCFVDKHADFGVGDFVFDGHLSFVSFSFFFQHPLSLPSSFWLPSMLWLLLVFSLRRLEGGLYGKSRRGLGRLVDKS